MADSRRNHAVSQTSGPNPGQHDQAERPVEQQHARADQDERQHGGDQRVEAVLEQRGDGVDVGGLPGDHPARRVVLVKRHRQQAEVREQPPPQVQHDALAEPARRVDVAAGGHRLDDHRDGERGGEGEQRPRVMVVGQRRDALVDADPDQPRAGQRGQAGDHDERHGQGRPAALPAEHVGEQAPAAAVQQRAASRAGLLCFVGSQAAPRLRGRRRAHRVTSGLLIRPAPGGPARRPRAWT